MLQTVPPYEQEYRFRTVHAVHRHLAPGTQVLLFADDRFGREVRSAVVAANILGYSEGEEYTARLKLVPETFPELQQGDLIHFVLEQVLSAQGTTIDA